VVRDPEAAPWAVSSLVSLATQHGKPGDQLRLTRSRVSRSSREWRRMRRAGEGTRRWQSHRHRVTFDLMDTLNPDTSQPLSPETEAERRRRLAREAEGIAEARADVAAGRIVDEAEVDAWIDSIGTDHELPVPYAGR